MFGDPHKLDELPIASCLKVAELVEHERYAAGHASREVAARLSKNDYDARGHVFTAVVSDAFDHRDSSTVTHAKALARTAGGQERPARSAVHHRIADDHIARPIEAALIRRANYNLASRHSLADIIVRFANQRQAQPGNVECAEALASGAGKVEVDRSIGKTRIAVAASDQSRDSRADRPIGISNLKRHRDSRAVHYGLRARFLDNA